MKLPKETREADSPHGRWYGDACGTAFALELLGERWSLLVVRELMFGPRRFSDIRASLPGISAKTLAERLASLESHGILARHAATDAVPAQLYGLTDWGHAAEPLIQELGRWAAASPLHDPTLPLSAASFMLSLRTMFDAAAAGDLAARIVFAIGTVRFTAHLADGALPVERGEAAECELGISAPSGSALAAVFYGDMPPAEVGVEVTGDPELFETFRSLFELPDKRPA
ncbi:helix-turn-helix domain-containing protein [Palleronia sp. LCG004]|uniref:winged helix-turn-helix transcriptional regulator n=1 Tax=Palleronia sp. LCG004 TaxID=3079304 RepID=UPI0029431293|nr:helix-turn-helix domain-containing protein [Palleronia sp. LCG004]WOI56409.1 helix-turn-helix domain-containing protein [Palleronia sp. LCG004]